MLLALKACLGELLSLHDEAVAILRALSIDQPARIVRDLCSRFHVLQAYFAIRHQEARMLANSEFGCSAKSLSLL
jgi:hypothetical protein